MTDLYSNDDGVVLQPWRIFPPMMTDLYSNDDGFVLQWWWKCTHDGDELELQKKQLYKYKQKIDLI